MRFTYSILLLGTLAFTPRPAAAQAVTVRLAVVPSPEETGLLQALLPDFERESGYRVTVYSGEDVHDVARAGRADLVISHYGHSGTEAFMAQGLGLWPRAVFANQIAMIGPATDPAGIRGLQSAVEAFRRVAVSGRAFVSNNSAIMKYTESILWEGAQRPAKASWFIDTGASENAGMALAARMRAYYIFALPPFLSWKQECLEETAVQRIAGVQPIRAPDASGNAALCEMDALVVGGAMPNRVMVSMVVNPQRVAGVNAAGATALQDYLLRPAVQARIENFRDPRTEHQVWRAAGLHNSAAMLGFGRRP